jgi:uncharacterized heparinase superfamily protein
VRWLRPVQVYGRAWFRWYRPKLDRRGPPDARPPDRGWRRCARPASLVGPNRFRFLGVEREVATPGDWNNASWPKLWLYNAHYFSDLVASDAESRRDWHYRLLKRWIAENPPTSGNGWEPYPTSLRIVNWIKWLLLPGNRNEAWLLASVALQVRWLRRRLEFHLLGNHLWTNAKALVFAGAFFSGNEATLWREKGLALVRRELAEQLLPDGGHFERSPMYHALMVEDLVDLVQLAQVYPDAFSRADVDTWTAAISRMLHWLQVMSHPDGEISFFNDAAMGIAPGLEDLTRYARDVIGDLELPVLGRLEHLADSGFCRVSIGPAVLIADVGPIGPDYIPGHSHADTLSFELSLKGHRVLVNGGTSTYDVCPERLSERGTAAHNTMVIDGADSSEVWGSFRVARRARVFDTILSDSGDAVCLEASHDGYLRLPGRVIHRRRWILTGDCLTVTDVLKGRFETAEARYRFAPSWRLAAQSRCAMSNDDTVDWSVSGGTARTELSHWSPGFGVRERCELLAVSPQGGMVEVRFNWRLSK